MNRDEWIQAAITSALTVALLGTVTYIAYRYYYAKYGAALETKVGTYAPFLNVLFAPKKET
jgi:uncharacterized membrane protein